jgi:acetyl esterase/lipase
MLTNPEDSSQPADISQSPPAADAGGGPSQLLGAFIDYLLARPTSGASESAGFDDGTSEMEGVTRGISAIFADMHGFPPMLILVGENEILYDDATRIRDVSTAAGVNVAFESWRLGIHVWPVFISAGLPESAAAVERLATFFKTQAAPWASETSP